MLCNCIFLCNYGICIIRCDLELNLYEQKIFEIKSCIVGRPFSVCLYPNIRIRIF